MTLLSLPDECFNDILSCLDDVSLYQCLFVNRYFCRLSVSMLWREPFKPIYKDLKNPLNTLITCLDDHEISLLIPCAITFNNQTPLFDYGKFIKKISHCDCVQNITEWLYVGETIDITKYQDCRVQKLVNSIYHMIMRQGSNLQELKFNVYRFLDLPKISVLTIYKPGIINLRYLKLYIEANTRCQKLIEFLTVSSRFCDGVVKFDLHFVELNHIFVNSILDFIRLQPLERMKIHIYDPLKENLKKILYCLEFRSETMREIIFENLNFQGIDLSFMSNLESLERLEFTSCHGFTLEQFEPFPEKKFHLKELKLWDLYYHMSTSVMKLLINSICDEALNKLTLNYITLETIEAVKESCPNLKILYINIDQYSQYMDSGNSTVPVICELLSLKTLHIQVHTNIKLETNLAKILGDCLTSVECLSLNFFTNIKSFEYFTTNCKSKLKKLVIHHMRSIAIKDYLKCIDNYQKVHKSLKVLGIYTNYDWTDEELIILDSLKNQGINIVSPNSHNMNMLFY